MVLWSFYLALLKFTISSKCQTDGHFSISYAYQKQVLFHWVYVLLLLPLNVFVDFVILQDFSSWLLESPSECSIEPSSFIIHGVSKALYILFCPFYFQFLWDRQQRLICFCCNEILMFPLYLILKELLVSPKQVLWWY